MWGVEVGGSPQCPPSRCKLVTKVYVNAGITMSFISTVLVLELPNGYKICILGSRCHAVRMCEVSVALS